MESSWGIDVHTCFFSITGLISYSSIPIDPPPPFRSYNIKAPMEVIMTAQTTANPTLERTCAVSSRRRERPISLQVYYDLREQDGCKIYTIKHVEET